MFEVRDVRLFDGVRTRTSMTVRVDGNRIVAVTDGSAAPTGEVIDGTNATLLPGLIDAHVHAWGPLGRVLERSALFGVTMALEMACDGDGTVEVNEMRGGSPGRMAGLLTSSFAVTVPGAHGTEYGFPVPTVEHASDVAAFVDARIAEGADYIKVIHNDPPRDVRTERLAILAAAVEAAHDRGMRVVAHVSTLRSAVDALDAGVDVLGHLFGDILDEDFPALVASHGASVIPTLTALETFNNGSAGSSTLAADLRVAPYLTSFDRRQLSSDFAGLREELRLPPLAPEIFQRCKAYVPMLVDAGVPVMAGTDAPNPGTTHGASMHRELELLVESGLTPTQALAAGTSVPAVCFSLGDRGRIEPGARADLLLVNGDPTSDITATRDIARVWVAGQEVDRNSVRRA